METGQKEPFGEHYIVANSAAPTHVRTLVTDWLKRLHHRPGQAEREYFVVDINGISIPYWVVSMEVHTVWKGLVRRAQRNRLEQSAGGEYLIEKGQFRRNYRWAISARENLCEFWGMTRLHHPKEPIDVQWDGFPLDSTFTRGQIDEATNEEENAYESREFFEFKYANGLPILGIQVGEEEALRRARMHVNSYHKSLSELNVDYLLDYRSETEVAGIQLIHLPFWNARYVYRPRTVLKHFYKPAEKNVILNGFNNGILQGELAIHHSQKVWVNSFICSIAAIIFFVMGIAWHPAFFFVALFSLLVAGGSALLASIRANRRALEESGNAKRTPGFDDDTINVEKGDPAPAAG
jgi:hypothetical protein